MEQEVKNDNTEAMSDDTRMHFRDYLRITEIVAIVILVIVFFVGTTFRGSAPISVTNEDVRKTVVAPTSTLVFAKPVETERFVVTNMGVVEGSAKENIATADTKIFKAPVNFKSFTYDASLGKKIALGGACKDAYYALLIFKSTDDYRTDPARSYYNTAYECPASGLVSVEVDLKEFNLPSGSYYVFLSDQGNTGSWYNPR